MSYGLDDKRKLPLRKSLLYLLLLYAIVLNKGRNSKNCIIDSVYAKKQQQEIYNLNQRLKWRKNSWSCDKDQAANYHICFYIILKKIRKIFKAHIASIYAILTTNFTICLLIQCRDVTPKTLLSDFYKSPGFHLSCYQMLSMTLNL